MLMIEWFRWLTIHNWLGNAITLYVSVKSTLKWWLNDITLFKDCTFTLKYRELLQWNRSKVHYTKERMSQQSTLKQQDNEFCTMKAHG